MGTQPLWPITIAVAVPVTWALVHASPWGASAFCILVLVPLLVVWYLAAARAAWRGVAALPDGRRALAYLVLPIALLSIGVAPSAFIDFSNGNGDEVYFLLQRKRLEARAAASDSASPKLLVFSRGGMLWASYGLIYDESDELMLPEDQRSAAWNERSKGTEMVCGYHVVRSLGSHFYAAGFSC